MLLIHPYKSLNIHTNYNNNSAQNYSLVRKNYIWKFSFGLKIIIWCGANKFANFFSVRNLTLKFCKRSKVLSSFRIGQNYMDTLLPNLNRYTSLSRGSNVAAQLYYDRSKHYRFCRRLSIQYGTHHADAKILHKMCFKKLDKKYLILC